MRLDKILSGDYPKSRILTMFIVASLLWVLLLPWALDLLGIGGVEKSLKTAVQFCIFVILAASYDLVMGYTRIISLAHALFFAVGAYSVGLILRYVGDGWGWFILASVGGVLISMVISALVALVGLRVKELFFTMITFAISAGAQALVVKFSRFTGGRDGLLFDQGIPELLSMRWTLPFGSEVRLFAYYFIVFITIAVFLVLLRLVNSPFGKVIQAVGENEFRAQAIGFQVNRYRMMAIVIAGGFASLAGVLYGIWLKVAIPNSYFDLSIMLTILIAVVIGGRGTIYGAVIGAAIAIGMENYVNPILDSVGQTWLPNYAQWLFTDPFHLLFEGKDVIPIRQLFSKNRWPLYIGVTYILCVYFFSGGIVPALRNWSIEKRLSADNLRVVFWQWDRPRLFRVVGIFRNVLIVVLTLSILGQAVTGVFVLLNNNGWMLLVSAAILMLLIHPWWIASWVDWLLSIFTVQPSAGWWRAGIDSGRLAKQKILISFKDIRVFVVSLIVLFFVFFPQRYFYGSLPRLGADMTQTTVSGLSSGGFMAGQFHVAHSSSVIGAGIVAGGPYFCSQGDLGQALGLCTKAPTGLTDEFLQSLLEDAKEFEQAGLIDPLAYLSKSHVYIVQGKLDPTVVHGTGKAVARWYEISGVETSGIILNNDLEIGHAWPTRNYGNPCAADTEPPWLSACGIDLPGQMLNHFYEATAERSDELKGEIITFDQTEFFPQGELNSFSEKGFAYIPDICRSDGQCRVHVFFHGCQQGYSVLPRDSKIDDSQFDHPPYKRIRRRLVDNLGLNEWADSHRLVILYPQLKRTLKPNNPRGCYDFWGFTSVTDDNYATKEGLQIRAVWKMVEQLAEPNK